MPHDVFSKRGKRLPDVYQYTNIPQKLRQQIVYWLDAKLPEHQKYYNRSAGHSTDGNGLYTVMSRIVCEEHGLPGLTKVRQRSSRDEVTGFILGYDSFDKNVLVLLDLVELACRLYVSLERIPRGSMDKTDPSRKAAAISELNHRFRENEVGFEFNFDANQLIRIDNTVMHAEVVQPVLHLLTAPKYAAANSEFLLAFKAYKEGDFAHCILEATCAEESVLKIICHEKNWTTCDGKPLDIDKATAMPLIKAVVQNASFDTHLINGLYAVAGLRNEYKGHGDGRKPIKDAPQHLAQYCLNATASNILFLIEATK